VSKILVTRAEPRWSIEETQTLEDLWPKIPKTRIEEAIPNRTWYSIRTKASRLDLKREALGRNPDGTFQSVHKHWSLENFVDGFVSAKGRFWVYFPDHPRAFHQGYIFRSIVAYEAYHGILVPKDMNIHHINGNKLDDSKENLEMLSHSEHSILSNPTGRKYETRVCENCDKEFEILAHRLHDFSGGSKRRGVFCSQKCYHEHPRSEKHKQNISRGLKLAYKEGRS